MIGGASYHLGAATETSTRELVTTTKAAADVPPTTTASTQAEAYHDFDPAKAGFKFVLEVRHMIKNADGTMAEADIQ